MLSNKNSDSDRRLNSKQRKIVKPVILQFMQDHLRASAQWHSCYRLKQFLTARTVYCFEADFYDFALELGYKGRLRTNGNGFEVKATWKSSILKVPSYFNSKDNPYWELQQLSLQAEIPSAIDSLELPRRDSD